MQNNMSYDVGYHTGYRHPEQKSIFGRLKDSLLDILTNEEPEQPISLFQLRERNDSPVQVSDSLPIAQREQPSGQGALYEQSPVYYAPASQVVYSVEDSAIPYQPITIPAQAQAQVQTQAQVSGMQRPATPADYSMISTNRQQSFSQTQAPNLPPNQQAQVNPMADRFQRYLGQEEPAIDRHPNATVSPKGFPANIPSPDAKPVSENPFNPFFQAQPGQRTESLFFGQTPPRR